MVEEKEIVSCPPEQDLNEMMRVRREKMDAFRSIGVAPFGHRSSHGLRSGSEGKIRFPRRR